MAGDYLAAIRDFALHKGINVKTLLQGSNLPLDVLINPTHRIGEESMQKIALNFINALDDPFSASIEYGRSMTLSRHGSLGVAVQGARNLSEAADLLVQFISTRSNIKGIQRIEDDGHTRLRLHHEFDIRSRTLDKIRLFFDFATLLNIDHLGRQLLNDYSLDEPTIINIDQPKPEGFPVEDLLPDVQVHFDQCAFELCIPNEWMGLQLSPKNMELASLAAGQCESELDELTSNDLVYQVRKKIRDAGDRKPTLEEMAESLHMSVSTLQRRLKHQKTTYQRLKAEERLIEAKSLLATSDLPLEIISERLGFSDASNFSKSFKSWVGMSPNEYRKSHGKH